MILTITEKHLNKALENSKTEDYSCCKQCVVALALQDVFGPTAESGLRYGFEGLNKYRFPAELTDQISNFDERGEFVVGDYEIEQV